MLNDESSGKKSAAYSDSVQKSPKENNSKTRKRKRCETTSTSDESECSELDECRMEDVVAIEKKLRTVAKVNNLSSDEMKKLLKQFVINDHVLALITIKAEDELAREKKEKEQRALIITDTPSIPKLTRAKARELNKAPVIAFPSLVEEQPEIAALIKDELHSDEDDEEYTFKDDDFISDDDPNVTASDLDSQPNTPLTPLTQPGAECETSPIRFTTDGCFKIPLEVDLDTTEDMRIATRTRSKFCLQKTTIEDLQSEFIPPDVEHLDIQDAELAGNDEDWMEFLNEFSKPMNTNLVGDDDDPVNDPEYVAAEKVPFDAEELRDVNISKKELTELVAELFEGLMNEGVSFENVELETPQKFLQNNTQQQPILLSTTQQDHPTTENEIGHSNRSRTDYTDNKALIKEIDCNTAIVSALAVSDATVSSTNVAQIDFSLYPHVISTPSTYAEVEPSMAPAEKSRQLESFTSVDKLIGVSTDKADISETSFVNDSVVCLDYSRVVTIDTPYYHSTNATVPFESRGNEYVPIRRHIFSEYTEKFEKLKYVAPRKTTLSSEPTGFTPEQFQILQQQLRIHVQFLAQNFMQTYCHPDLWKLAPKAKEMLEELSEKAKENATFNTWNMKKALTLVNKWEEELSEDNEENRDLMKTFHAEIERTSGNTRTIPQFPERIMKRILASTVFIYPDYLPRIPFTPKRNFYHVFAPSESILIAMGLEKHINLIRYSGERLSKNQSAVVLACERLAKDTLIGKTKRRIWDHVKLLRDASYYNPVKFYFEHKCAPPINHNIIYVDFDNALPPEQRASEMPLVWQKFVKSQQASSEVIASPALRESFVKFVRKAVGEDISAVEDIIAPDSKKVLKERKTLLPAPLTPDFDAPVLLHNTRGIFKKHSKTKSSALSAAPQSVTINVNYVFDPGAPAKDLGYTPGISTYNNVIDNSNATTNTSTLVDPNSFHTFAADLKKYDDHKSNNCRSHELSYTFEDFTLKSSPQTASSEQSNSKQKKLTEYFVVQEKYPNKNWEDIEGSGDNRSGHNLPSKRKRKNNTSHCGSRKNWFRHRAPVSRRIRIASQNYRRVKNLKKCLEKLLIAYRAYLQRQADAYVNKPLVYFCYRHIKALQLYTNLLIDLKMFCKNVAASSGLTVSSKRTKSSMPTPGHHQNDDDVLNASKSKKANRQEENFRHMLLPDSAENANRKDAIYAFNFYEKVEEVLKSSKRPEDCKKFNHILKSFDPKRDKVAVLYNRLENLFLPDHPELAQVFLTFLLPSEAAEVGKFFEHFMSTNMATFINKLNVYFNKQPAQIRKVFNCLNELADDTDVTIGKIKSKIIPLLKGNQFLIDWFLQLFPSEPPPERLLSTAENINLKEVQMNQSGEFIETLHDVLDSPTHDQQHQACQLKYINGRIFYGSKIALPAKLSFMATSYQADEPRQAVDIGKSNNTTDGCIHGIREYGERRLSATPVFDFGSDENDNKSEEEDDGRVLIIDTNGEEDSSSHDACDEATLRAHAVRLNPSYYGTSCYTSSTSTPNASSHQMHHHHPHAKKSSLTFATDEGKISPRKHMTTSKQITLGSTGAGASCSCSSAPALATSSSLSPPAASAAITASPTAPLLREKRKSPTKRSIPQNRSPILGKRCTTAHNTPMVVVHAATPNAFKSNAIATAKKLKSLVEDETESETESIGTANKQRMTIIATAKTRKIQQMEQNMDDEEYSTEDIPPLRIDTEDVIRVEELEEQEDSDEKKKDITSVEMVQKHESATHAAPPIESAWTRDEDKIILIEMKVDSKDRDNLFERINSKLTNRKISEIAARHQFLMDFLSKLQGH